MTEPLLLLGDCLDRLREMDDESVDAVVTDPPYGLGAEPPIVAVLKAWLADRIYVPTGAGFMGKTWDAFVPDLAVWRECFRVLKPGGYLLAFGGTRTLELVGIGIRLAGFERRDLLMWLYGSGFPKSLDVAKAIDKAQGVEGGYGDPKTARHAEYLKSGYGTGKHDGWDRPWMDDVDAVERTAREYLPGSDEAREWSGWGTALKPAVEPIVVARKPLVGTVAANVLAHGTGALNIDACRIAFRGEDDERESKEKNRHADFGTGAPDNRIFGRDARPKADHGNYDAPGRWPANVLLSHTDDCVRVGERQVAADGHWPAARPGGSELAGASGHVGQDGLEEREASGETVEVWDCSPDCPVRLLDEQTGDLGMSRGSSRGPSSSWAGGVVGGLDSAQGFGDRGGASRFFYTAKTSRAERNAGLGDDFEARDLRWSSGDQNPGAFQSEGTERAAKNHHPTVKPVALMRWLVRLVAPPGAVVCDPYLGSGTTGIACDLEGISFVGIEREPEYLAIADARMRFWREHGEEALAVVAERDAADRRRREIEDAGQLDLFAAEA